jgi:hypothetical protein
LTECPNCHTPVQAPKDLIKEWDATPKKAPSGIKVMIHYWRCPKCGNKFRTATRTWPSEKKPKKSFLSRFGRRPLVRGPQPS